MRLFGLIDDAIDRHDRAGLLTPPFDLAFAEPQIGSLSIGRVRVLGSASVGSVTTPSLRVYRTSVEPRILSIDRVETAT